MSARRQPALYMPHGGGPCFFMAWTIGPADTWNRLASWLGSLRPRFENAKAILLVSAHWEERVPTVQSGERPPLLFDYYGFPPETYELTWPAPGAPEVAARVRALLEAAGIDSREDPDRGFDHGAFIPLKVALPAANVPTLQLSLDASLDAGRHVEIGRALSPLRDEGVIIVGSGMSFHNTRAFMSGRPQEQSRAFDAWLVATCTDAPPRRDARLAAWNEAPEARYCHPREEHLLPLMVVAGAAPGEVGRQLFRDEVMGCTISAFGFGADAIRRPAAETKRTGGESVWRSQ